MTQSNDAQEFWDLDLQGKPDFQMSMKRIYAWYQGDIIDRPPVQFNRYDAEYEVPKSSYDKTKTLKDRWFDTEYQVETFKKSIEGKTFHGETFPVFWPNLGPDVYAAFYGGELEYADITSWSEPIIKSPDDIANLKFNPDNEYFKKLEEMTQYALEQCQGKFIVGYSDFHPGMDCVVAWRGPENLCMDFYDNPEMIKKLIELSTRDFHEIFNHFDDMVKAQKQLSVTWIGIPSFGKMHIPSCDFSAMLSSEHFEQFCLPILQREVKPMTQNIYHVDGKGVAAHIDLILQVPQIHAIQWVQGAGDDEPIMQWVPLIKKIQAAGKPLVLLLKKEELDDFCSAVKPEGIFVSISAESEQEETELLKRIEKW